MSTHTQTPWERERERDYFFPLRAEGWSADWVQITWNQAQLVTADTWCEIPKSYTSTIMALIRMHNNIDI
jgi:hypothetical protein